MIKQVLTLAMAATLSLHSAAFAASGSEGVGGGGVLARLLVNSQGYLLEELPRVPQESVFKNQPNLREVYLRVRETILKDVKAIEFQQVTEATVLTDPHFGYKTWIRILSGSPVRIEYNPSLELYKELVESQTKGEPREGSAPRLRDVIGFVLHELGHHYGLSEEMSWRFAIGLQQELEANPKVVDKTCKLSYQGATAHYEKEFILTATDEFHVEGGDGNIFSVRHLYFKNAPSQLYFEASGPALKLALRADANSLMDFAQENANSLYLMIRCAPKGHPLEKP